MQGETLIPQGPVTGEPFSGGVIQPFDNGLPFQDNQCAYNSSYKIRLINSTVFACSNVCPVFVALDPITVAMAR